MIRLLTLIGLLISCFNVHAQVTVSAALDNSQILIGDHARLHLEANFAEDHQVTKVDLSALDSIFAQPDPSKADDEPGQLEILEQTEWETLTNAGNITYRKDITLTCWKEGVYFIPQIRFGFRNKGTDFTRSTNKLTLLVSSPITQNEVVDTVQIAPIKDIVAEQWRFSDFLPILYILGGSILFIIAVTALVLYIVRRKQGPPPIQVIKRPAHEIAFQKLRNLKAAELWQNGDFKEYQSQLTYIIREYIENRYDVPALESTTRGILADLKEVDFPNDLVDKTKEMLQLADMVKFAKATPPESTNTRLMDYAEEIVETTKLVLSEEEIAQLQAANPGTEETFILPTHYASAGKRFLAYFLDSIIFQSSFSVIIGLVVFVFGREASGGLPLISTLLIIILFITYAIVYFAYPHSKNGQTVGKKILKIKLIQADGNNITMGKATLRFFIKIVSIMAIFLPTLPILFNKQKQALHDMVASSVVINKTS